MRAERTFESGGLLLGVSSRDMDRECLSMEKLFLTCRALEREMTLVRLKMIVHGILILFRHLAHGTDILAGAVFLVDVHGLVLSDSGGFNINF